jgi:hypothetical protein
MFLTINSLIFSQNENKPLNETEVIAPDGSFQVTITMANGSRDIIEIPESILKEISVLRKTDIDYVFNLTPTISIKVFSYLKLRDEDFYTPEIYIFID